HQPRPAPLPTFTTLPPHASNQIKSLDTKRLYHTGNFLFNCFGTANIVGSVFDLIFKTLPLHRQSTPLFHDSVHRSLHIIPCNFLCFFISFSYDTQRMHTHSLRWLP